jgi:colanic acid biosynthesis glycosyl transferase WcaI
VNILYLSQYFPPELCAPAVRVDEFTREWARKGHAVRVLTGFPNHPEGVLHPGYRRAWMRGFHREVRERVGVCRTWLLPAANRGFCGRMANYTSFALSASVTGPLVAPRRGVVIATSPQILVGAAGYWVARSRCLPFVFEVRDLWPQSIEAVGAAGKHSLLYRGLDRLARFLYSHADRIVLDGEAKRSHLIAAGVPAEKTGVIRNGVDPDFCLAPDSAAARAAREAVRRQLGLAGRFLVAYIGTLGMAHGLERILLAAERLRDFREIAFLLVGEGAERDRLREKARALRLGNVLFLGKQPREAIPAFLSAADVCLVPLRKREVFKTAIPSKMFEAMAAAKPVILGVEGEARDILTAAGAGIAVPPEDPGAFTEAVLRLYRNEHLARDLGECGRRAVVAKYSRRTQAAAYLDLLRELDDRFAKAEASPAIPQPEPFPATLTQIARRQNP